MKGGAVWVDEGNGAEGTPDTTATDANNNGAGNWPSPLESPTGRYK